MELLFGVLFGVIGSAYLVYGKRQYEPWFLVVGLALIVFPYFVSSALLTALVGLLLVLLRIAKHKQWF